MLAKRTKIGREELAATNTAGGIGVSNVATEMDAIEEHLIIKQLLITQFEIIGSFFPPCQPARTSMK